MAATSTRTISITYTGDVVGTEITAAAINAASPGQLEIKTLASGNNTINAPSGGTTPIACTIVPPVGNTAGITLKGVAGDTGIPIHKTDPTSIAIDSSLGLTFVIGCSAGVTGCRFFWT